MPSSKGNKRRGPAPVQKHIRAVGDQQRVPPAPGKVAPAKPNACPNCANWVGPQGPRGPNGLNVDCPCCLPGCPNYSWKYTQLLGISRVFPNNTLEDAIDGNGNPAANPNCLVENARTACDLYDTTVCPNMPEAFTSGIINEGLPTQRVWVMGVVCCEGGPSGSSTELSTEPSTEPSIGPSTEPSVGPFPELSSGLSSEISSITGPGPFPGPSDSSEETQGSSLEGMHARYVPCSSSGFSSEQICWQITLCTGPGSELVDNDLSSEYENNQVIKFIPEGFQDPFCFEIFGTAPCEGAVHIDSYEVFPNCSACEALPESSLEEASSDIPAEISSAVEEISSAYQADSSPGPESVSSTIEEISSAVIEESSAQAGGATYTVSGAGTSDANGVYTETGTHNGKPLYTKGVWSLYYANEGSPWGDLWAIGGVGEPGFPNMEYANPSTASTPPTGAWSDTYIVVGDPPAPTVS